MKLSNVCNKEWGSKARKREESQKNLTHKDAALAIDEGLTEVYAGTDTTEGDF